MPRSGKGRGGDGHSWIWLMRKGYWEKVTCEWHAKGVAGAGCGESWELNRKFACHSKQRRCYQSITFLGSRARSLFSEPLQFTSGIPRKTSCYLHNEQCPLWLHVPIFTLTTLRHKNSPHTHYTRPPSARSDSVLLHILLGARALVETLSGVSKFDFSDSFVSKNSVQKQNFANWHCRRETW